MISWELNKSMQVINTKNQEPIKRSKKIEEKPNERWWITNDHESWWWWWLMAFFNQMNYEHEIIKMNLGR